MKKLILSAALFAAFGYSANAQNPFEVTIDDGLCLDEVKVIYTDHTSKSFELGCAGLYTFDIGTHLIDYVIINGTDCYAERLTDVEVNDQEAAKALLRGFKDSERNILNVIR